jgi:hypothetical protein
MRAILGLWPGNHAGSQTIVETIFMRYEGIDNTTLVTRAEAIAEVRKHCIPVAEFLAEMGDRGEYKARAVLAWLGY